MASSPPPEQGQVPGHQVVRCVYDSPSSQPSPGVHGSSPAKYDESTLDQAIRPASTGNSLQAQEGTPLPNPQLEEVVTLTGEGPIELQKQIAYACKSNRQHEPTHDEYNIKLNVEWEVHQAMSLGPDGDDFSRVLSISGGEVDAQATTCGAYIQEHFTAVKGFLPALQAAWNSGSLYETSLDLGGIHHLSIGVYGRDKERAAVIASGSLSSVVLLAKAFAWFCCMLRPSSPESINLSTFKFDLEARKKELVVNLHLSWRDRSGIESCWHDLFKRAVIALDSPISDRSQFRGSDSSLPKGLDVPFDIMVELAVINFPFEHERGIVLKGFSTLLVPTAKWITRSGIAIQWHYVRSSSLNFDLLDYVWDSRYHVWDIGEEPAPVLEIVKEARSVIG